jgi:hypothetical protein
LARVNFLERVPAFTARFGATSLTSKCFLVALGDCGSFFGLTLFGACSCCTALE